MITTKFLPATNHKGSRVKAYCGADTLTLPWDHALSAFENHEGAALALATRLRLPGLWLGASLPDASNHAYVFFRTHALPAMPAFKVEDD